MGKKNREGRASPEKIGKRGRELFSFLGKTFDDPDKQTITSHMLMLVIAVVAAKFIVAFITTVVFHSFVDLFDIGWYMDQGILMTQGQTPYITFDFPYPILLLVPIVISMVPAILFNNGMAFVYSFQALMVICDIVTILCVYLIALRLWNERIAFLSGLLYAAAFSAAYFVITKYDAFPTCLLMLAILFTVYGSAIKGYAASALGFFTKVFPILALPFLVLFNARKTSLKEEIVTAAKVIVPVSIILFVPVFILNPSTLKVYFPVRSDIGYYSNTLTFTLYSWIHDVFRIGLSLDLVSALMYVLMAAGLLALLYAAWTIPGRDPVLLIKLILCATVLVVVCAKVRSPQYIVWYTPLLCLLAADDIRKIALLFAYQALAFIEFPLMFGSFYTSLQYTGAVMSSGWMLTLFVFTLEYLALFVCVWFVVCPQDIFRQVREASGTKGSKAVPQE